MSLISTANASSGLFSKDSNTTPTASSSKSNPNVADAYTDSQIKPTLQQVRQLLAATLMRLVEQAKSEDAVGGSGGLELFKSPQGDSYDNVTDRLMVLSASSLVADLQLLITLIDSKYF